MHKIKVSQEVFEALEICKELDLYKGFEGEKLDNFIKAHTSAVCEIDNLPWGGACKVLNEIKLYEMMYIIKYGYEVKKDPKLKILSEYKAAKSLSKTYSDPFHKGHAEGFVEACEFIFKELDLDMNINEEKDYV